MKTRNGCGNRANYTRGILFGLMAIALIPAVPALAATAPVDLGTAASFRVLGGTSIASIGETFVYGDLGVNPGTLSGFPPGVVTGATHVADATAVQAKIDLVAAYSDAAGRTQDVILLTGEIGGLVLTQGLYKSGATYAITTDLTLDAQGDTNAVWIFQMGSTLGVAASTGVILTNGARSANVFWQIGSTATLGANSYLKGSMLANTAITIGHGATVLGRAMAVNTTITLDENTFTDEDTVPLVIPVTPAPVDLGSASTFGVMAGSTVVNVGNTIVYGDLAISPGVALVGFPVGIVNGATHLGDAIAVQAQIDLAAAYTDAASRTHLAVIVAAEIGGLTITQGLYKAGTIAISTGNLTLDGLGDTNAVWIFQIGSTLNTAASTQILLVNGARAVNVIWQVGSSATLGASSTFSGTIMADQSITIGAGVAFEGRALAVNAAVTLDSELFLVEDTVVLVTTTNATGPYVIAPEQNIDLLAQTITAIMTDSVRFYALRSSTALTIMSISNSVDAAVITYKY